MSAGRYVMMTVSDTGHGMSADVKAHLFEPYFTTKEAGKGSGLGLSTVYGIVQQSGGYISVYSETGRGTTFKILLPRAGESVESPHETPPSGRVTGSETILLAEDEEHIRRLASRVLRSRGYTVIEASDGESALKAVRELAGSLDLLITDVGMPEMSGEELARRVVEQRPGVRVLFISGYGETAVFKEGVPAGMGFLQKPFSAQALAQKLRQILDHGPRA
jgi:CheY-like chemotaxis protein